MKAFWAGFLLAFVGPSMADQTPASITLSNPGGPIGLSLHLGATYIPITGCSSSGCYVYQYVQTQAALTQAAGQMGLVMRTGGAAAAGDGGGADYNWFTAACAVVGGGCQPASGGGSWNLVPQSSYSPVIWGADPSGANDSSAAINGAATYLCGLAQAGGTIYFPPGTFKVNAGVNAFSCSIKIKGSGAATLVTAPTPTNAWIFKWSPTGWPNISTVFGQIDQPSIEDIVVNSNTSVAYALDIEGTRYMSVRNVVIENCTANCFSNGATGKTLGHIGGGIYVYGSPEIRIDHVQIWAVTGSSAINFFGDLSGVQSGGGACATNSTSCTTRQDWETVTDVGMTGVAGTGSIAVNIQGFVDTVNLKDMWAEHPGTGLKISCQTGLASNGSQCPQFVTMTNFESEFFDVIGTDISDATGVNLIAPFFWGANTQNNVVHIYANNYTFNTGSISFTAANGLGRIGSSAQDCISLTSAHLYDITFDGINIYDCSVSSPSTYAGVASTATLSHFHFVNSTVGDSMGETTVALSHALDLGGTLTNAIISNNLWGTNASTTPVTIHNQLSPTIKFSGNTSVFDGATINSCGTGAAMNASYANSDLNGVLTVGTGTVTTCSLTLGYTHARNLHCSAHTTPGSAASQVLFGGVGSTTSINITGLTNFATATIAYECTEQ